jgi:hypothetical protein
VRAQLGEAQRIAVEIRPEGVLLRPEMDISDDFSSLSDAIPQDAPPERRRFLGRLLRRRKASA